MQLLTKQLQNLQTQLNNLTLSNQNQQNFPNNNKKKTQIRISSTQKLVNHIGGIVGLAAVALTGVKIVLKRLEDTKMKPHLKIEWGE